MRTDSELFALFEAIACERLAIDTLKTRGRDRLDFHDISVWALIEMMTAAYDAGLRDRRGS